MTAQLYTSIATNRCSHMMHAQISGILLNFFIVIYDIISNPHPFPQMKLYMHCTFSFSLQKGNHNVTGDV